jgi:hypothetical protein
LSTCILAILGEVKLANLRTEETMKLLRNQLKSWQRSNQLQTEIENETLSEVDGRLMRMTMKIILPSGKNLEVNYRTQEEKVTSEKLEGVKLTFGNHVCCIRSEENSTFEKLSKWIQKQALTLYAELKEIRKL